MARFDIDGITLDVPEALLDDKIRDKLTSGEYEHSEARAARMRVRSGNRVLELGAGIGFISSVCAQLTDPKRIITVEANPETLGVIRQNLDLNGGADVQLRHGAIVEGESFGQTVAFRQRRRFWSSTLADTDTTPEELVEVPTIPLFPLLEEHRPHVVILDIEGAEQFLFDRPWPSGLRHVIVELHPGRYPNTIIQKIVDCMSRTGLTYDPGCSRGGLLGFRRVRA